MTIATPRRKAQAPPTELMVEEEGSFVALCATWDIDRQNERLAQGAFAASIESWRAGEKSLPILWNHKGDAADVVGDADPDAIEETAEGLVVEAQLDIEESEAAREAWRSVKAGRLSLSFGYLIRAEQEAEDGVRELLEVDLVEVSLTASPVNGETRIISAKAARPWLPTPKDLSGTWFPQRIDYSDAEWAAACILDKADFDPIWQDAPAKDRYALPISEPGADEPNAEAIAAAADTLANPEATLEGICAAAIDAASARLLAACDEAGIEPPASLAAGQPAGESSLAASRKALGPIRTYTFEI